MGAIPVADALPRGRPQPCDSKLIERGGVELEIGDDLDRYTKPESMPSGRR